MFRFGRFFNVVVFSRTIKHKARIDPFRKELPREPDTKGGLYQWFLLSIPVSTFALGCWQIRRREWKLNLLKSIEDQRNNEPIDIPEDLSELEKLNYAPVRVRGRFLHDREILIGPRAYIEKGGAAAGTLLSDPKKNQGYLVVTPFLLQDGNDIILINRGWVPKKYKNATNRPQGQIQGDVELVGIVRDRETRPQFMPKNIPSKGQWFYRDIEEIARFANTAPVWLDACGADETPDGWPLPNQTRINFRNEHLSYVITWFSLSGITGFMWFRTFVQRLPLL